MQIIAKQLAEKGFHAPLEFTGEWVRFDRNGTNNGSIRCVRKVIPGKNAALLTAFVKDWKTNEEYYFEEVEGLEGPGVLTDEERTSAQAEQEKQYREEKERRHEECAQLSYQYLIELDRETLATRSPYSEKKQLGFHALKDGHNLIVELFRFNQEGIREVTGYQTIYPNGDKAFAKGTRLKGSFFYLSQDTQNFDGAVILVCEGYATGASLYEAAQLPTVCAMNAGNLSAVVESWSRRFPTAKFLLCADNDQWTEGNPGLTEAYKAAQSVPPGQAQVTYPMFDPLEPTKPTDWNDYAIRNGAKSLAAALQGPIRQLQGVEGPGGRDAGGPASDRATPKPNSGSFTMEKQSALQRFIPPGAKKPQAPSHRAVANALFERAGGSIVRQEEDLFRFTGTHWELLSIDEVMNLKRALLEIQGGDATASAVDSCYRIFCLLLPHIPKGKTLFTPSCDVANFKNGTLYLLKDKDQWTTHFREGHQREDFINWVSPFSFTREKPQENSTFLEFLEKLCGQDKDKLRALQQCAGALLLPSFPQLFFFIGRPGGGKSTAALLLAKLVDARFRGGLAPGDMHGFMLESLLGRVANIVTDIGVDRIPPGVFKMVEDASPISINRKNKSVVTAKLPNLHLFCCNELPKNYDGGSKAYGRRVNIIRFDHDFLAGGYQREYQEKVWAGGSEYVVWWAYQGLLDLIQGGGIFFKSQESKEHISEWEEQFDLVAQFVNDLGDKKETGLTNEIGTIKWVEDKKIERGDLWKFFREWEKRFTGREHRPNDNMDRNRLYKKIEAVGFKTQVNDGVRYIKGLELVWAGGPKREF